MFKELGLLTNVMKNLPKIKDEAGKLQQRLAQLTVEGDAGAGMVKIRMNGKCEVLSCTVADDLLKGNDKEFLEEMIRSATNNAVDKAKKLLAEETNKAAAGLGLPGLPDLSMLMGS
jgi:DNA-binding YbaB/EbfC family protein